MSKHFKDRMFQRFGVILTNDEVKELSSTIDRGDAKFIRQESASVHIYRLNFWRQEITVIYNKKQKVIITVLPERDIRAKVVYQGEKRDKKEVANALMEHFG